MGKNMNILLDDAVYTALEKAKQRAKLKTSITRLINEAVAEKYGVVEREAS